MFFNKAIFLSVNIETTGARRIRLIIPIYVFTGLLRALEAWVLLVDVILSRIASKRPGSTLKDIKVLLMYGLVCHVLKELVNAGSFLLTDVHTKGTSVRIRFI